MAERRSYGDPCGVARALDRVGDRWALLVVRELLLGPRRFTDLRAGLPHLGPDVLAQRLRQLEQDGVVRRTKLPPPAASRVYALTDWGRELEPVILALGRWGSQAPFPETDTGLGADALMIALKTVFDASRADSEMVVDLKLGEQRFRASVAARRLDIARGEGDRPDATIDADPPTLAAVLWHGHPLEGSGIALGGDPSVIRRFLALFQTPQLQSSNSA